MEHLSSVQGLAVGVLDFIAVFRVFLIGERRALRQLVRMGQIFELRLNC